MFTPGRTYSRSSRRRSSMILPQQRGQGSRSGTPRNGSFMDQSSQILLEETDLHVLESFGNDLPVVVTEIIYLSEKSSDVSVRFSPNGWAWLVHGRRLIVWKYKNSSHQKSLMAVSFRELTLPPSDLHHNARLINVCSIHENVSPSCLAVSPEGIIRYWSSIAHEGCSVEISADLQGQECWSLTDIQPVGSILGTTTSTLMLIHNSLSNQIACRLLKSPQGLLGGIGRKVSSLFWGSISTGGSIESKLMRVLGCNPIASLGEYQRKKELYVLTSTNLQKWLLSEGSDEDEMFYDLDAENMTREAFVRHLWPQEDVSPSWLKVSLLDFQLTEGGVAILSAAINPKVSDRVSLALGIISTGTNAPPMNFRSFYVLKNVSVDEDLDDLSLKFLLPRPQYLYLYNNKNIICVSGVAEDQSCDVMDFGTSGNSILGVGSVNSAPLFFTRNKGLITITPTELKNASIMTESSFANESKSSSLLFEKLSTNCANLSVSKVGVENLTSSKSFSDKLKGAFLCFCEDKKHQAVSIVEELFPTGQIQEREIDSAINRIVVQVSRDVIDDFPAMDPRWMESLPPSEQGQERVGASMSLLIKHQLEDKKTALDFYINFLKKVGLWDRLSGVIFNETLPMSTHIVLGEHSEKIVAALTLRNLNAEYSDVIEKAIRFALKERKNIKKTGNLTPQDHFYREISKVEQIVPGLLEVVKQSISTDQPEKMVRTVSSCNKVVLSVIKEAVLYRSNQLDEFSPTGQAKDLEYLPWTSSPGPLGLRNCLTNFFKFTLEQVVPLSKDSIVRSNFYEQLVEYADVVLDGYNVQIESISEKTASDRKAEVIGQYEKNRISLITPLISNECYEEAASLAEKYLEFGALVRLCEITNDKERLERYMDKFSEQNFSDFVFSWHVKEGKQGKLLSQVQKSGNRRQEELGRFLTGHAGFSWIHDIQTSKFKEASLTLKKLALNETEALARKQTMLSLSKLTALASDEPQDLVSSYVNDIEQELTIALAQNQLPRTVTEAFGLEHDDMKVLSPKEIIELYISNENFSADHIDFKKALDLLDFVRDMDIEDKEALRLHIWVRAVLRNEWSSMNAANPVESVKETVFYKLVEFCQIQGLDIHSQMFACDELLSAEELSSFAGNKNFKFFLQTAYEHLIRCGEAY